MLVKIFNGDSMTTKLETIVNDFLDDVQLDDGEVVKILQSESNDNITISIFYTYKKEKT